MVAVARQLKKRYGSTFHLYCGSSQEKDYYTRLNEDGLFESITMANALFNGAQATNLDEEAITKKAVEIEARIGTTYNTLAVSNRHLGRGYALGGFHHPRSRVSKHASYAQLLHAYNEAISFWDREIVDKGLTLILNGPREAAPIARLHGIPFRVFAGSRFGNFHNWAWNEHLENPEFEEAYERDEGVGDHELDAPYSSHLVNRKRFIRNVSPLRLARRAALEVARYAWWQVRGYDKAKGYYLNENLRYFYRIWRDWKRLNRIATASLADLEGKSFVYYPLHLEPEAALQGLSPEYFYQLSLIAALSRDLPAGVRLAVKEAFGAVGRRPADFYAQIAEFKNVVTLEPLEFGLECVRRADAVVTICGTAGFEGAVLGKPVIAFGHHNIYNFLPHVRFVTDEGRLKDHLREALGRDFDRGMSEAAGKRFLRAVAARSFDMRGYDFINVKDFDSRSVEEACDALVRSIELQFEGKVAVATASAPEVAARTRAAT